MKGILINVKDETITEVEIKKGNVLKDMYKHIDCRCVDRVSINDHDDIWVDDEGLLSLQEESKFFSYSGSVLAGNGLILGVDGEGNSVSPKITMEEVKTRVKFHTMRQVRSML